MFCEAHKYLYNGKLLAISEIAEERGQTRQAVRYWIKQLKEGADLADLLTATAKNKQTYLKNAKKNEIDTCTVTDNGVIRTSSRYMPQNKQTI